MTVHTEAEARKVRLAEAARRLAEAEARERAGRPRTVPVSGGRWTRPMYDCDMGDHDGDDS